MTFQRLTLAAALMTGVAGPALAQEAEPLDIVFTVHSGVANTFWQTVQKGFEDACAKIEATCQMVYVQTDGSIPEQVVNIDAALARNPDAIITSIVDNAAYDDVIQRARDADVIVIASNVDDLEGAEGNARQAFVGQGFIPAGRSLSTAIAEQFPAEGPIHVAVGVSAPGQNWSEQRAQGIIEGLEEWAAANPDREFTMERIDSGTDLAIVSDRVGAYLAANPNTNAYLDTGFWHAGVARVLADRGTPPGEVLLGGFDLVPEVLDQMSAGYVQVQVDQQPYMQGFLPVMMVYLSKNFGLAPADIDTGQGLVTPDQVADIMALSEQGLR
jgi:simple sugar transport system substrate-binding protein